MDPQPNSISHRLRLYFRNSPKRIIIAWIFVHLFTIFTIPLLLLGKSSRDFFDTLMLVSLFFTVFGGFTSAALLLDFIGQMSGIITVIFTGGVYFLHNLLYYGSFIRLIYIAQDTTLSRFRFWHRLCIALFAINAFIVIFFTLIPMFYPVAPSGAGL